MRLWHILVGLLVACQAVPSVAGKKDPVRVHSVKEEHAEVVKGLNVGAIKIDCSTPNGWEFACTGSQVEKDVCELLIVLSHPSEAHPPEFSVSFDVPQRDAHHKWTTVHEKVSLPPNWGSCIESRLCSGIPLAAFVNDGDTCRILAAASEAKRKVRLSAGLREEDCHIAWKFEFFSEPEAPMSSYAVRLRLDMREIYFGTVVRDGMEWIERTAGHVPARSPELAFEPLYSTWYSFHQNLSDREIEAECAEAAKLGMKVLIVDDGWQTEDNNRGYAYCGDWEIAQSRFPDMALHVRKIHDLGMKYVMWYGVPMLGIKAKSFARFKDKLLWIDNGPWSDYGCLDPRFPEVRDYLCDLYEKAVREWDIDGLKLDFIDAIGFRGEDPAVKECYSRRDIRSLPEAVDRLLKDVYTRLTAIKPEFLFEFRQSYIGPGIRQYGNMMRAADCPGDLLANRCRTANLRLTSGKTAVHADMLKWNVSESPEGAARFVLATIFSTIQYSVMLRTLPDSHRRMMRHWMDFARNHRDTLLKGEFRPHHFESMYPLLEAESASERIIAVYSESTVVDAGEVDRETYVLNATGKNSITLRIRTQPEALETFDTFGNPVRSLVLGAGVHDVQVPSSGYLKIRY